MTIPNKPNKYGHRDGPEPALIYGRLHDVNPEMGTAILHAYLNSRVPLSFEAPLKNEMLRLETKFVKVRGHGWFDDDGQWIAVVVEEIAPPPPPRTAEEILNDPNPKIFDPDKVPPMLMSDEEWDAFDSAIREGRGRREL